MNSRFEKVQENITKYEEDCRKLADYLTDHPEISGEEVESCKYIVEFLRDRGYEVETPYAEMPHSFRAVCKDRKDENCKRAALLCEYDALPEVGHACGHSVSGATSILAGLAFNEACKDIPLRLDLIGTPGEEFVGGKALMTPKGAFDGYEYAAIVHMNNENQTFFKVLASNDRYFTFHGKASHASAAPEMGANALNGARLYMEAMDMWRQHLPSDCQLHGIVENGGEAANIVPEHVTLDYYFRAETMENLRLVNEKAETAARGAAMATGTTVEWQQRYPDYGEIFCNKYKDNFLRELFALVNRESVTPKKAAGSSDAGNVDMKIPVFHPMIDITGGDRSLTLHDKKFAELLHTPGAYQGMRDGAVILAAMAFRLALEDSVLRQIQEDHREYRNR